MKQKLLFRKLYLIINTTRYLRWEQFIYRIWYLIRDLLAWPKYRPVPLKTSRLYFSVLANPPVKADIYQFDNCFSFLNQKHCFEDMVDWNTTIYGKLWSYNLNYFEFINQKDVNREDGVRLILSFIDSLNYKHIGLQSYPISLRSINLIKYLIINKVTDSVILESLYGQCKLLSNNVEYHLLGNHLLENGLSLFTSGVFFNDIKLIDQGSKILKTELEEQIMKDGAHFELSPMYHQTILERILDVLNIISIHKNLPLIKNIYGLLQTKAEMMLGWLNNMTFSDGSVPHFNDSTFGISLTTDKLNSYAAELNVSGTKVPLSDSGYRRYNMGLWDCIIDAGDIGPDYQPGHGHSDTFTYVLNIKNVPVIVDTGISTYEHVEKRLMERRTSAHNTFQLKGVDQSEVWSSFRVARRAHCTIVEETDDMIYARHDGYCYAGIRAERTFTFRENKIIIKDLLSDGYAESFIHFHPDISVNLNNDTVESDLFIIKLDNYDLINKANYEYSEGYNRVRHANMIYIRFYKSMTYQIIVK